MNPAKDEFRSNYEQMTDEQLQQVLADRKDLVPEAAGALEAVVQQRNVSLPPPPRWVRSRDSTEPVRALEDYDDYREVQGRYRWTRRWAYLVAIAPLCIDFAIGRDRYGNSEPLIIALGLWALGISIYGMNIQFRYLAYKCPQCGDRFGSGKECRSCGFPRTAPATAE